MHQIDNSSSTPVMPAIAAEGASVAGWFQNGNPQTGTPATQIDQDWLNDFQAEIVNVLTAVGIVPSRASQTLLLEAIRKLACGTTNPTTQTANFAVSNQYYLWPVNLAGGSIEVTLPTDFTQDFEILIKAIGGSGGPANTLTSATAVDGTNTLIQSAAGWVKLYFSAELGTWSITG